MVNLEYIRLAWESVRSHKVRAALTLLGMVIGVFAIIVAVTAVKVIETDFSDAIRSFGVDHIYGGEPIERASGRDAVPGPAEPYVRTNAVPGRARGIADRH